MLWERFAKVTKVTTTKSMMKRQTTREEMESADTEDSFGGERTMNNGSNDLESAINVDHRRSETPLIH